MKNLSSSSALSVAKSEFSVLFSPESLPFKVNAQDVHGSRTWSTTETQALFLSAQSKIMLESNSQNGQIVAFVIPREILAHLTQYFPVSLSDLNKTLANTSIVKKSVWIEQLLFRLQFECLNICGVSFEMAKSFCAIEVMKEIHFQFDRNMRQETHLDTAKDKVVQHAIHFVEKNIDSKLTMSLVAKSCKTSASTLNRRFQDELGLSFIRYLRKRRLTYARQLLSSGLYNVSQAAWACGYEDLSSFSKAFKREFGSSPSANLQSEKNTT